MNELCISVRQPWAALIMAGVKRVENRSWPTKLRGRLWIHAAATLDRGELPAGVTLPAPLAALPRSCILGTVQVIDCLEDVDLPDDPWLTDPFVNGPWCWLLADPRPLTTPYACKGRLGLWTPPAELFAALPVGRVLSPMGGR